MSTEVIINPFDDIVPREISKSNEPKIVAKPILNRKLSKPSQLSFVEEEDISLIPIKNTVKLETIVPKIQPEVVNKKENPIKNQLSTVKTDNSESEDEDFDEKMRNKVLKQKRALESENPDVLVQNFEIGKYKITTDNSKTIISLQKDPEQEFQDLKGKLLLELKKRPTGSNSLKIQQDVKNEETFLSPLELRRYKFFQKKVKSKGREGEILGKLNSFLTKVQTAAEDKA